MTTETTVTIKMKFSQRLLYLFTNKLKFWVKVEDSTIIEIPAVQIGYAKWTEQKTTVIHDSISNG